MDTHDHGHEHPPAQAGPRKARDESIIRNQTLELNRINDNRIYLLSIIDDLHEDLAATQMENASLKERLEQYEDSKPSMATIPPSNGDSPDV